MHLLSQNALPVNDGVNGSKNVIVRGDLGIEQINTPSSMDIQVQYQYLDNTDPNNPVPVYTSLKLVTEADQQTLYQAVKTTLPDINADYSLWYKTLLFEAFRFEMAARFGIPTTEIDIIP